jgi:large subunit ribosomal protein L31
MKSDIHPKYFDCQVTCGCGNSFKTRATVKEMRIEICSACHPFFSGKQKFVDSAGAWTASRSATSRPPRRRPEKTIRSPARRSRIRRWTKLAP